MARPAVINVMEKACRKAGRALVRDFGEVENLQVSKKGPADFVTTADTKCERTLRAELSQARPAFGFLMEESGASGESEAEARWIVDPLDGTLNFMHGLPHFAISIGLERRLAGGGTELEAGMVFNPVTDEMFWATKGGGAFLNDRRIRVSARRNLDESVFATGIPFRGHGDHPRFTAQLAKIMPEVAGIRRFGAAALDLAFVAAGRYEGFWEASLNPWDIAAGILLVKEAGGFVTDFRNGQSMLETGDVVATNERMHGPLLRLLRDADRAAA